MAALDDPHRGNPIADEVVRVIEGFTENFCAHVERLGYIPSQLSAEKAASRCGGPHHRSHSASNRRPRFIKGVLSARRSANF